MSVPALDLVLHNLMALGAAVVALMVLAQLLLTAVLRASTHVLRASVFGEGRADAFRKHVKRAMLMAVAFASVLLLIGSASMSFMGLRVFGLMSAWFAQIRREDLIHLGVRLAYAAGIAIAGFIASALARMSVDTLSKMAEQTGRFTTSGALVAEVLRRLRIALRTAVLCGAAMLMSAALELPLGAHRGIVLVSYVLVVFYASRFIVVVAHLLVDMLFEMSGRLTKLESPLKYLGSLTHLAGLTKRSIDYFVYVAGATWVADQFTPDTWFSRAGHVGIRIVGIFYASRVIIEVCLLFINEIFLNKTAGHTDAEIQQRKTLVPVAVGLLRYGIYFSALVMVLREAAIDPTPLLAGAGVLGVAVGFGAQAFVGDIVAGFFILFETVILVGDQVEVSGVRGTVEEIGVRITKIRDEAGVLHAIPNGEVRKVANHSKAYVNAVVEVYVPYDEDLPRIRELLVSVTEATLRAEGRERVAFDTVNTINVRVHELGPTSVLLRVIARVPPGKDAEVAERLRARILDELRATGVVASRPLQNVVADSSTLRVARPAEPKPREEAASAEPWFLKPPGG